MRRYARTRRGLAVLIVVTAALALPGCSGSTPDPAPTTLHPGTAATPTTSTPSADPTDLAGAAAIAAVQKLYADFARMAETGLSGEYRLDFTRACTACAANARLVDQLTTKGEQLTGDGFEVKGLTVVWNKADLVIVQGQLSHPELTIRRGQTVIDRIRRLPVTAFAWRVVPVDGAWRIASAEALK